jgi:hypothetical protein
VERLRESGRPLGVELEWAAGALGPGARGLAEDAKAVGRSGVKPLDAASLVSTATSYTLALRLVGVESKPARDSLATAARRTARAGDWENFDLGAEWSVPSDPKLAPLGSLAARPAVRPGAVLLARSSLAREAMERSVPPATEVPEVAVAADCLGDVLAARLVLNNHTHLPNSGPDLLAFGVSAPPDDPKDEVLCLVGDSERVGPAAEALGPAFEPDARDGVSGERMNELVADAGIDTYEEDGLSVARVKLTRAPGTDPGFLFGAFDRGSLLTYMGLQPPPSPGG